MKTATLLECLTSAFLTSALLLFASARAFAHCDGLDGPVVKAAQRALAARDPALVLIWVQAKDEPEIRTAFEHTLEVRTLSPRARELADRYFFETLVRVHRTGEGASYTGLKPAGRDLGPAIPAADRAIDETSVDPLLKLLTETMQTRVRKHFDEVIAARSFKPGDVSAGREYVRAYVEFIHDVERIYEAAATPAQGHFAEADSAAKNHLR